MTAALETPYAATGQLLTGHFHETSGYSAYRQAGVRDWLLIYTASGLGRFGYPGGEFIAQPGDWVLLHPGTMHDYGVEPSLKKWELLWAHFQPRPEWLGWLNWPSVHQGLLQLTIDGPDHASATNRFQQAHALLHRDLRRRETFAMNALEEVLLLCDQHNPATRGTIVHERIARAIAVLDNSLDRKITLDEVASAVGLSQSRLAHLFKAETGQTPQRYLEARRMQRAAELLERTSFSIKQIAATLGFDTPFYFSQRFKLWTGHSPTTHRQADTSIRSGRS